ncbi:MAG: hypothetical protein OER96_07355 [Gammaproteobacteria bacterium]|nr:hypothetical protein [Gammaproteobacteria bacterium]
MLENAGFVIESENSQLDYCGSLRTIYVSGEKRVLLEWDGEEGFGYAEVWKNGEWEKLPTNVLESTESEFQKAIENLAEEMKEYL